MGAFLLSLSLPCATDAPRSARLAVGRLREIDDIRDDAVLVVSELVSNAVRHSGSREEDEITLEVSRSADALTISVRDSGRAGASPQMRADGALGNGGYGLVLVDGLSRRWGSRDDHGRVVWAQMSVPSARRS